MINAGTERAIQGIEKHLRNNANSKRLDVIVELLTKLVEQKTTESVAVSREKEPMEVTVYSDILKRIEVLASGHDLPLRDMKGRVASILLILDVMDPGGEDEMERISI